MELELTLTEHTSLLDRERVAQAQPTKVQAHLSELEKAKRFVDSVTISVSHVNTKALALRSTRTSFALRLLDTLILAAMSPPSPPVWYLKNLSYNPQDRRDIVRSVWRAVAELDSVISQELASIQSAGIAAVVVR